MPFNYYFCQQKIKKNIKMLEVALPLGHCFGWKPAFGTKHNGKEWLILKFPNNSIFSGRTSLLKGMICTLATSKAISMNVVTNGLKEELDGKTQCLSPCVDRPGPYVVSNNLT